MDIRKVSTLRGPNAWGLQPALEVWVDLQQTSAQLPDHPRLVRFVHEISAWLEGGCTECGSQTAGSLVPETQHSNPQPSNVGESRETPLADESNLLTLMARLTLELQASFGSAVDYLRIIPLSEPNVYRLIVGYDQEDVGRACWDWVAERVLERLTLNETATDTAATATAATDSTVTNAAPTEPATTVATAYAELAETVAEQRLRPAVAELERLARVRRLPLLRLPGEAQMQLGWGVRQRRFATLDSDRTSAVGMQIVQHERTAKRLLRAAGTVLWEPEEGQPIPTGLREFQTLLVADRIVATVEKRTTESGDRWVELSVELPVDTATQWVEGVRMIGLDAAVVAWTAVNPSEPLDGRQGGVLSVQAPGGLDAFGAAGGAALTKSVESLLDHALAGSNAGRIPVVSVTGTNGKTTTTRLCAHIVAQTGKRVGMTCTDGIYIHGRRIDVDDCAGPKSARNVLLNPTVEAAVLETARGGILREGLAFDVCDVAVVTNIGAGDHLGLNGIDTVEQLARVKRTIVDAVAPRTEAGPGGTAVLKADDPFTAEMAAFSPGSVVFFCRDSEHPVIVKHRLDGGRVVFVRDNFVVLAEGGNLEIPLLSLDRIPLTHRGRIWFQVENVLAATAANWALGIPAEVIRIGLETFGGDVQKSPGRFNLLTVRGVVVICDYGHNTSSLQGMIDVLRQFPQQRRLAVYTAAGDRRDVDMIDQGRMLGEAFDEVYLYEDQYMRGRSQGEIMGLFRQGLDAGPRVRKVGAVQGWNNAVDTVLGSARPGDLVLLQADTIDEAVEVVSRLLATESSAREINFEEATRPSTAARTV